MTEELIFSGADVIKARPWDPLRELFRVALMVPFGFFEGF